MSTSPLSAIWKDTCTIYKYGQTIDPTDHSTSFSEIAIFTNQVCRVSRNTKDIVQFDGNVMKAGQGVMLYLTSDIDIPKGCKIAVTHMGKTINYTQSGEPFKYDVSKHQEIPLKLFEKYA